MSEKDTLYKSLYSFLSSRISDAILQLERGDSAAARENLMLCLQTTERIRVMADTPQDSPPQQP